jgi:hypothetical protein
LIAEGPIDSVVGGFTGGFPGALFGATAGAIDNLLTNIKLINNFITLITHFLKTSFS